MNFKSYLLFTIIFYFNLSFQSTNAEFNLTILHNNDIHARFPPITEQSSLCRLKRLDNCMAGVARTVQLVSIICSNTIIKLN